MGNGLFTSNSYVGSICRSVLTLHSCKKNRTELSLREEGGEFPARLMKLQLSEGFLGREVLPIVLTG